MPSETVTADQSGSAGWQPAELDTIRSLWLGSLPPLPDDPSNAVANDPRAAVLGQRIFFDSRFSGAGDVSCATCHQPERLFTDGLPLAQAVGTTKRGTPTIIGLAYSPWFFWDGRRDSQWSQALAPMEDPAEHNGSRTQFAHILYQDATYRAAYEALFGPMPALSDPDRFPEQAGPVENAEWAAAWENMSEADRLAVNQVFANIGKAIAAYERLIVPGPSRFDAYVQALVDGDQEGVNSTLSADELAGLRLFINQGNCTQCHNGPLFASHSFHSIGLPDLPEAEPDIGRLSGVQQALSDPFNCLGDYSDAGPDDCAETRFAKTAGQELMGAFKVPTLRNVAETAPYMHTGQFATLAEVLAHYNAAPAGPTGHSDLFPLGLSAAELDQLEAFLRTLSAPAAIDPALLAPPAE